MSKKVNGEQGAGRLCPIKPSGQPECKQPLDKKGVCPKHCSAKTPRGPCKRLHSEGRRRCYWHGGATPVGLASPHFKTGDYSRHVGRLSPPMLERYEESKHDPQVLSVLPEINLLDARIAILLDRAQRGESTALLTRIEKAFDKLVEANDSGDEEATAAALAALGQTVRGTRTDREAWEEISEKIDQRDRLTKSENRRLRESAELVQMSIVLRLLGAVALSLRTHVADRAILQAVQDDLALLTGGAIDQLATAGGPA